MSSPNLRNDARVAFLDGQIVPESEAKVSISDFGVRRGDAAFDSWRTRVGVEIVQRTFLARLSRPPTA